MQIYVVTQGDTVDTISLRFGIPVEVLTHDNQIVSPYRLAVGQALLIQDGNTQQKERGLISGGYAYPFINSWVLDQTLPYLSELYIFSYGFTRTGELIDPPVDDRWMINAAEKFGTTSVLTLTPLGADGHFNSNLVTILVHDLQLQQKLILQLLQMMREKGYGGIDIDFEYILAEDRLAYAEFVAYITKVMNLFGYQVTVALAPKTARDQPGVLYEGIDYRLLGAAANRVLLMTYEWGYTYGRKLYRLCSISGGGKLYSGSRGNSVS